MESDKALESGSRRGMEVHPLSLGEMAATLAHEVRNPLSLVWAHLNLLELGDGADAYKHNFHIMKRELNKISELVTELVNLSMLSAKPERIGLPALLTAAAEPFRETYGPDIDVSLGVMPDENVFVYGNAPRLALVFNNIIKNAVDALLPRGKGRVYISLERRGDGFADIAVSDDGPGITPEAAAKAFDPLYTTKKNGSGIGLYASRAIVAQHGGSINIAPGEGGGCTVLVTLPVAD